MSTAVEPEQSEEGLNEGIAAATACQWLASKIGVEMYLVRSDAMVGAYMGTTANNIRNTTDWIASSAGPSVVLFDEVESLFPSREDTTGILGREISSAMTTFWQILDRWNGPQLFCFATNRRSRIECGRLPCDDSAHSVGCVGCVVDLKSFIVGAWSIMARRSGNRNEKLTESAIIGGLVWRAVEHELPDSNINVLIYGPGMNEPLFGYYDDEDESFRTTEGKWIQVTHWMDLPQPPGTWFEQAECLTWSIAELARSKQVRSRNDMDDIADDLRELADKIDEIDLVSGE